MPRGVAKSGRRMTQKYKESLTLAQTQIQEPAVFETDDEILSRIGERFEMLEYLTQGVIDGDVRGSIVSGPPGLGKSFTIEQMLEKQVQEGRYDIVKGFTRATGIYQALYSQANGGIVVFDDADSAFNDDVSLNLIKAATDTTEKRVLSWRSETKMQDQEGDFLPTRFEFKGSVIFITNFDFDGAIENGHRLAPHFEAMINRAYYLDLMLKTRRDYFLRIKQMVDKGMMQEHNCPREKNTQILNYIEKNINKFRPGDLSLRTPVKLWNLMRNTSNWERVANVTMLKNK